jgi:hypothetical protein
LAFISPGQLIEIKNDCKVYQPKGGDLIKKETAKEYVQD